MTTDHVAAPPSPATPASAAWTGRSALIRAAFLGLGFGAILGWLTPRGPITTGQAVTTLLAGLALGVVAGITMPSRWVGSATVLGFAVAFEITRLGTSGPTVDGIHPGSMYGMIAFVAGRGAMAVLILAPILLGAACGRSRRVRLGTWSWTSMSIVTVALVTVGLFLLRPASTAPILGGDGRSIAELATVEIDGVDQAIMIRGRSIESPVLLFLAGGPGGTEIGAMRDDVGLEQDFVVATWDQPGTGKSYAALDPVEELTLDRMVADTIAVAEYLRDRFDEEKIYLVGNSWGTTLGVLAVQEQPELFHALVGTGQMVSQRATDVMFWEDTLAWAETEGDSALVTRLEELGPPPYANLLDYEPGVFAHVYDWGGYAEHDGTKELPYTLFVPEYTVMDRLNAMRGLLDTFATLYPQLQDIDFRVDVPSLEVPFTMVVGAHEARGRAVLADEWFEQLEAPSKERVVFEHSGHRPSFEEPARFVEVMREVARQAQP